jgi:hypothetical protein
MNDETEATLPPDFWDQFKAKGSDEPVVEAQDGSDETEPRIPDEYPPMLFVFPKRLSCVARLTFQRQLAAAIHGRRMFAFDSDVRVYQLAGRKWRLIK